MSGSPNVFQPFPAYVKRTQACNSTARNYHPPRFAAPTVEHPLESLKPAFFAQTHDGRDGSHRAPAGHQQRANLQHPRLLPNVV